MPPVVWDIVNHEAAAAATKSMGPGPKVSEATVCGWIRCSRLHAIEIGKSWRIAASDLEAFRRNHATRAREAIERGCGSGADATTGSKKDA